MSAFSLAPQPPLPPRRRSTSASFAEWHLDLRLLRAFLAVAEEGQIGRAAHRLSMAASPLSRQIARLEDTIGVRLFERHGGGVRMTGPGKVLFREAQELAAVGVARLIAPSGPLAPDFTLTDPHGKPFTLSSQRGRAVALFFGYTHCPDVCPTTLAALAHAKKHMGAAGNGLSVVFVTVDPRRDNPVVMGRYVQLFDPSFIGLSGTAAQLAPIYGAYHVYHQNLPEHGALGYLVAHSSVIDFIGRDGRIRGTGDWSDTTTELATEMRQSES